MDVQMEEQEGALPPENCLKDLLLMVGAALILKRLFSKYMERLLSIVIQKSLDRRRAKETCFRNMIRRCNRFCQRSVNTIIYRPKGLSHDYKLRATLFSIWQDEQIDQKVKVAKMLITNNMFKFLGEIYCTCVMVCYSRVSMGVVGGRLMAKYFSEYSSRASADLLDHLTYCDTFCKYYKPFVLCYDKHFAQTKEPVREAITQIQRNFCHEETIDMQRIKVLLQQNKDSLLHYSKTHMFSLGPDRISCLDLVSASPRSSPLSQEDKIILGDMLAIVQRNLAAEEFRQILDSSIQIGQVVFLDTLADAFSDIESELSNCEYPDPSRRDSFIEQQPTDILHKIGLRYRRRSLVERKSLTKRLLSLDIINRFALQLYEAEQIILPLKDDD